MYFLSIFSVLSFFASLTAADTSASKPKEKAVAAKPATTSPLLNANNFVIFYAFADENLEAPLKEAMIKYLQKLGSVYPGDDSKLTENQKEEKYKKGMVMNVVVSQVTEENSTSPSDYKKLPVLELSLNVRAGAEPCGKGTPIACTIWEKEKFIGIVPEKKEFVQKTVNAMGSLLDAFISDYQKANSAEKGQKPQFFLYS